MNKYKFALVLIFLAIVVWSPWITKEYAEKRVINNFEDANRQIMDGCGFNCTGCGLKNSTKVPFGYVVKIAYTCGLKVRDSGPDKTLQQFVSFFGTVHPIRSLQINISP